MKKQFNVNYKQLETIGVMLILFFVAFLFMLRSPLNMWSNADAFGDSSVFQYMAFQMSKGYMPYRDFFDHKGPLIYLINLLGICISGNHIPYVGIWVLELISMYITVLFLYKISRLCSGKFVSIVVVLFSISILIDCFEEGNFVEEYAMAFLAVSLYIYLDYFKNKKITKVRLLVCGFSFAAVCMLRPNMVSVWAVFCIAVLMQCIKEKRFFDLKQFICYFLMGFCIMIVPIIIWLGINQSLSVFWEDYIKFNFVYTSAEGLSARCDSFSYFLHKPGFLLILIISAYLLSDEKDFLYSTYMVYLLFTIFCICISGREYGHYGMIFIPTAAFPISSFLANLKRAGKPIMAIVLIYMLSVLVLPNWIDLVRYSVQVYANRSEENYSESVTEICKYIDLNTTEEEKISVYGNWNIIYVLSQRMSASKYSYQYPIGKVNPIIMDEYFNELEMLPPEIIVIEAGYMDERMKVFLDERNYELVWNRKNAEEKEIFLYKLL